MARRAFRSKSFVNSGFHREMSGAGLAWRATPIMSDSSDLESLADPKEKKRRAVKRSGDLISTNACKRKPFLS